jgi:rhamnose utilization protein RhaD (predicted bifunctional aldolase and dehydrogenase)
MNDIQKKNYDQVIESVNFALKSLSELFEVHGMVGMYNLTNPNLEQLKAVMAKMKAGIENVANNFEHMITTVKDMDAANASINVMNIKQGLVYAESLLLAVEKLDYDKCIEAHDNIKDHNVPPTQW